MAASQTARAVKDDAGCRGLVAELEDLDRERQLGDVRERLYRRRRDELIEQIGRAKVRARLRPGEVILAEHHFVQAHFPFTSFAFKDVAEESVAFYATDQRLFRWRFVDRPLARVESLCRSDQLESLAYSQVREVVQGREHRRGEAAVAIVMVLSALLFWSWLEISGPMLALVGGLGLAHALLLPTPYWSIRAAKGGDEPWLVYAARNKSARALLSVVQERVASGGPRAGHKVERVDSDKAE